MKTTIGIPVYDDFAGLKWTIQNLLIHHNLSDSEIVVVDNHPIYHDSKPSKQTLKLIQYVKNISGKYFPLETVGTAPARNKIFEVATGDIVIVCDSHVILHKDTIKIIKSYFGNKNNIKNIVTGPLLKDKSDNNKLKIHATHYADIWGREMWGTWAQAWLCPCEGFHFDVRPEFDFKNPNIEIIDGNIQSACYHPRPPICSFREVKLGGLQIDRCPKCGKIIPNSYYHIHEKHLAKNGYIPRGWSDVDTNPFEIPGLGLGMFACHKGSWPGFPATMRGFGGGELHLHEAFRRNGGKAICLPDAKWWHFFEDYRSPKPYNPNICDKIGNYIIWRKHLNMPLEPVYEHFVANRNRLTDEQWEFLVKDPTNYRPSNLPNRLHRIISGSTVADLYDSAITIDKNFEFYFPIIKKLSNSNNVISISNKNHWNIAVSHGAPKCLISHSTTINNIQEKILSNNLHMFEYNNNIKPDPVDCDIFFLEITPINYKELGDILQQWCDHVNKWIVLIGTGIFNMKVDNESYYTITDLANKSDWKRVFYSRIGIGLTILSSNSSERSIDMGVGYNFLKLCLSMKIKPKEGCKCKDRFRIMNELGPDGCTEKFDLLVADLKTDADKYDWNDILGGATRAILNGLAFQINPLKPIESLLKIAIKNTREAMA